MKTKEENKKERMTAPIVMLAFGILILLVGFQTEIIAQGYNYDHVNVTTLVNITNAFPEIISIETEGASTNVTLNAGGTRTVTCNATIRDYNGFNDINNTNATFYYLLNSSSEYADDNNEHYTNGTCAEIENDGEYVANYTCSFQVAYYAYNGSWSCNLSVIDQTNFTDSEFNTTNVAELYALNVTDVIDYGNLSVTETSPNITATVTNFGNRDINVSVLGYGETENDLLGLVCEIGNISVESQRFSADTIDWTDKIILNESNKDMNFTLGVQTSDITPNTQNTYWQLYVPPNPFGACNGTVRFTATLP